MAAFDRCMLILSDAGQIAPYRSKVSELRPFLIPISSGMASIRRSETSDSELSGAS